MPRRRSMRLLNTRPHRPRRVATGGSDDLIAKLQQLASLKDAGVLSETEFAAAKQKLLS